MVTNLLQNSYILATGKDMQIFLAKIQDGSLLKLGFPTYPLSINFCSSDLLNYFSMPQLAKRSLTLFQDSFIFNLINQSIFSNMNKFLIICLLAFGLNGAMVAQSSTDAVRAPLAVGYYWKEMPVINSILDNELLAINILLNNMNLSDKNKAINIAYKSLILNFRAQNDKGVHPNESIEIAYQIVISENVNVPYKRALIIDEINLKKEELLTKLTLKS